MHMVSSYSSTFTKWLLNWHFDFDGNACHTLILMAPPGMVLLMASPDFSAEYFPQIQHHASCWSGGSPPKSQGKRPVVAWLCNTLARETIQSSILPQLRSKNYKITTTTMSFTDGVNHLIISVIFRFIDSFKFQSTLFWQFALLQLVYNTCHCLKVVRSRLYFTLVQYLLKYY